MCATPRRAAMLLLCLLSAWIAAVLADQNTLPAPQNVSVVSINMKHLLTWSPVPGPGNVTYSIGFQGEFERDQWQGHWFSFEDCTRVSVPSCDVTRAIATDTLYNLRVRAELGTVQSEWASLDHLFTRRATLLTPPIVNVTVEGPHLLVVLEDLGPNVQFQLSYWRTDGESLVQNRTVKETYTPVHLETVEAGMEYCVKAQTYVVAIHRYSKFSSPVCITVSDVRDSTLIIGLVSLFAFIAAIVILPFLAWKTHQMLRYSCCPSVVLPQTLIVTDSPRKLICPKDKWQEDCGEACAPAVRVVTSEEQQHLWMRETV